MCGYGSHLPGALTVLKHNGIISNRLPWLKSFSLFCSAALTGYGLEAFVDMAASCLVLWRFWDSAETEAGMRANEDREERANVVIAFIVRVLTSA